jgi:hypothetical protein
MEHNSPEAIQIIVEAEEELMQIVISSLVILICKNAYQTLNG